MSAPVDQASSALSQAPAAQAEGREFQVFLYNRDRVEATLTKLTKRAQKKGLPCLLTWTWGKAYSRREHTAPQLDCNFPGSCGGCSNVSRIPLTLQGETPSFAGWSFLAALEHMDGENIIRSVEGTQCPIEYRTRGPVCDHCHAARRRNETYVLKHETKGLVQVGSTCIADFLGSTQADKLAASASYMAAMRGCAEDGEEGFGPASTSRDLFLGDYLPMVAWSVREQGWVSRTAVRETGGVATADRAMTFIYDHKSAADAGADPTEEDVATATAAATWAEALTDEIISKETGDYLYNLRVIARNAVVSPKSAGLAASMVVAYRRAIAKERARAEREAARAARKPNEYVGTEGKRETWKDVTLDFVTGYETDYGYTTVCKFRLPDGNALTWKSTSTSISREDVGKHYDLTGTVKKHDLYKGEKQTLVLRCKLVDLTPPAAPEEKS